MNQADLEIYRAELFAKHWASETEFHEANIEKFGTGQIKFTESDELTEQEKLKAAYELIVKDSHDHRAMVDRPES